MRGIRVTKESRKLDVVLVAARYTSKRDRLRVAKGYVRRGVIWGDLILLPRKDIVQRLKSGERIVFGEPQQIPGSFQALAKIRLGEENGGEVLIANGADGKGDQLGLPLF
jgi:hypothetical protein